MTISRRPFLGLLLSAIASPAQDTQDLKLARQLADERTQKAAVQELLASGRQKIPMLLSWINRPPLPLDEVQLATFRAGLAQAFGALRVREAIPFLLDHIAVRPSPFTGPPWRTPETVLDRLPAVAALIEIGPDALNAILNHPSEPCRLDERLARAFVVSRIASTVPDKSSATRYLRSVAGEARLEAYWTDEALRFAEVQ